MADAVEAALRPAAHGSPRTGREQRRGPHRPRPPEPASAGRPSRHRPARSEATRSRASRATPCTEWGAPDMKGGLAVFLPTLAGTVPDPAVDVTWCLLCVRGGEPRQSTGCWSPAHGAGAAAGRRRHPGRADRVRAWRPDVRASCGSIGWTAPGPTPPGPVDGPQRHPPAGAGADPVAAYESRRRP